MTADELDAIVRELNIEIVLKPTTITQSFKTLDELEAFVERERTFWPSCGVDVIHSMVRILSAASTRIRQARSAAQAVSARSELIAAVDQLRQGQLLFSGTPQALIVRDYCSANPEAAKAAALYFLRSNQGNQLSNPDFFRGFLRAALYDEPSALSVGADREAIEGLRSEFRSLLDQLHDETDKLPLLLDGFKNDIDQFKEATQQKVDARDKEERDNFEQTNQEWHDQLDKVKKKWEDKFDGLAKAYNEHLRLEAPVKYWDDIGSRYLKSGRLWVWLTVIIAFTVAGAIAAFLYWPPKVFDADKITPAEIRWLVLLALGASVIVYILHMFVKFATSSYHLHRDAQERRQLTYVYLALIKEKAMEEKERDIVLSAIFSRSDTGLLKGDGAPALPGTLGAVIEMLKGPK
jgi:hypothetical protein